MERVEMQSGTTAPRVKSFRDFSSVVVECAALGASPALGSLSVPPAWPKASPRPDDPPPAAVQGKPPGLTYQDGLMGVMTGRAVPAPQPKELLSDEA
ncbi:hypothetical protein BN1232_02354 [Mycobacterium lentiflavum]|uniref:Uncharacterized protein n=1 Tax=Mycobacterium lentiflavum TaxID=141349 RepID=A0A0E4CMX5_MYCLN|nr:hypothetical protein [Mycobacterium lentiflavum]MEE3063298.1 hypothetical protein [Actinomycetota bacterium]ULP44352.1 hypothetical protein MJO58_10715 [Mycobacterium lentiflavum]CQD12342.1 hypothetical protein BN1232_02354 [Mycobacterium lentiflavum]